MPENRGKDSSQRPQAREQGRESQLSQVSRPSGLPGASIEGATEGPRVGQPQSRSGSSSFAARFGRVILGHGIAVVPTALYHFQGKLDLSAQLVWFISNILSHKWDEDLPYPSLNKMARSGGVDKTQLYDYKNRLCQQGLLLVHSRQDQTGKRDTNAYDFAALFARLEDLIAIEAPQSNAIRGEGDVPEQFTAELADSSFIARYGRVITSYGITAIPRAIFTHGAALGLSLQQVWFITYIFSYRWDTPLPYPSIKRMSARTGYSTVQLHNIKAELVRAGHLRLVSRYTAEGGQDSNAYDFSGLLDAVTHLLDEGTLQNQAEEPEPPAPVSYERSPRRGRKSASSKEDDKQREGGILLSGVGGAELSLYSGTQFTGVSGNSLSGAGGGQLSEVGGASLLRRSKGIPPSSVVESNQGMVVSGLHEVEQLKESVKQDDSNQPLPKNRIINENSNRDKRDLKGRYSPYIAALASDFSRELGDSVHEASNIKQALNLWHLSGLDEQGFVEMMQEARKLTRRYQGRPTWDAMDNKMAYYFSTLRDLVGPGAES